MASTEDTETVNTLPKDDQPDDESNEEEIDMEYRMMGGTGLVVSALSFGFWASFGLKEGVEKCVSIMRICRKAGINFFDNAEFYGKEGGNPQNPMDLEYAKELDAETIMGISYKKLLEEDPKLWRRSDVCFTTKLFWGGNGHNEKGLSRKHVAEGMETSLKKLQMDYVDVVFCHRPDPLTPTEEVVRGMSKLVEDGKAFC